jgi:DNA replication ATP-dependent helicase Dna2
MSISVGQLLGNYRLLELLGTGGFAEVYLGEHRHLGVRAAIKVLYNHLSDEASANFRVEARKIAHLSHAHIVRVLDFGVEDAIPFLVMDYAPNGTLRQKHPNGTPFPLVTILSYTRQVASALQYIHNQKLIHCDIKPANMLIGQDEQILLSDFGIATAAHSTISQIQMPLKGTPHYMAPEQLDGRPHVASDQYALGIVVYEWLSGTRPFNGGLIEVSMQHQTKNPPPLYPAIPGVTLAIEQVVMKALAKNPRARFDSVQAFSEALERAAQAESSSSGEQNVPTTIQQPPIVPPPSTTDAQAVSPVGTSISSTHEPAHAENKSDTHKADCFQCTLDPDKPCAVAELEGHLLGAYERVINGTKTPVIGLTTETGRVDVHLPDYYQKFVRELQQRDQVIRGLPIKLYHLPQPPIATENKGRPRLIFQANSYTLVVLEPDILLNITDLSQADYCARQYLLNTLVTSPPNAATLRGNLIHYCFKELLKAHNRYDAEEDEAPLTALQHHLETALQQNAIDLALANVSLPAMRQEAMPHLESLAAWYHEQRSTLWDLFTGMKPTRSRQAEKAQGSSEVSAETFLLAPEIGLKGRLDLYWQQATRQRLLELKTGGASGDVPKSGHRQQVNGYSSLLTVRRNEKKKAEAILLYSGTPGQAESSRIPFGIRDMQKVIETRNMLVLDHLTGIPAAPPGPGRCTKCSLLNTCTTVSSLLHWQAPEPVKAEANGASPAPAQSTEEAIQASVAASLQPLVYSDADRAFFAKFYDLLRIEGLEGERQQALLWKTPIAERVERGRAIAGLSLLREPEPIGQGEWTQTFSCENTSELREGDEVFLSNGNPIEGAVVTGTIMKISTHEVTLWTPELIANPTLIDRNESNLVHTRTLKNLLRWLEVDEHLRLLVAGTVRPRFTTKQRDFADNNNEKLNTAQQLAVERALRMQDYLLIQGPPGTGKTSVIAEVVKRLSARGERVLLAAFTNQAVDNMLRRLDSEGFSDYVRLGHDRSVHADVQKRLLKNLLSPRTSDASSSEQADQPQPSVNSVLHQGQVVASTTATWSSEKYAAPTFSQRTEHAAQLPLEFDVAIIDEASQLTIPAILGALRLAKRFILVGDDRQLPPLVLSKEAAQKGLADSLFSFLKQEDDGYMKEHRETEGERESACVTLQVQYRMNQWISNYSSVVFYERRLLADRTVKDRVLSIPSTGKWLAIEAEAITKAIEPKHPLVFLNVQPDGEPRSATAKSNDHEAQVVREIVQGLLARGIEEKEIGIIAPFRAQVANIRRALFEQHSASAWPGIAPETPMSIDTVDRFQGGERGVIIMSFTIAQPLSNDSPLREFLINPNRLNVALTRAQRKLILVGNLPALAGLPYFDRLLTYCRSMKTVITFP